MSQKAEVKPSAVRSGAGSAMPFRRQNYLLLGLGAILLIVGYGLLGVPRYFVDASRFSMALYVAPVVILAGMGVLLYAILRR